MTSYEALEGNGFADRILEAIGTWEAARMAGAFSPAQKARMEDVATEFHLESAGSGSPSEGTLVEVHQQVFRHERGVRQPGEPESSTFTFENPGDEQVLHWILTSEEGSVDGVRISIDGRDEVLLSVRLRDAWSLRYEGGRDVTVRDEDNQPVSTVRVDESAFRIAPGRHTVSLEADLRPAAQAKARLEVRPCGPAEALSAPAGE